MRWFWRRLKCVLRVLYWIELRFYNYWWMSEEKEVEREKWCENRRSHGTLPAYFRRVLCEMNHDLVRFLSTIDRDQTGWCDVRESEWAWKRRFIIQKGDQGLRKLLNFEILLINQIKLFLSFSFKFKKFSRKFLFCVFSVEVDVKIFDKKELFSSVTVWILVNLSVDC